MNIKTLTTTIVFAALTVALNPSISGIGVPAPYAPFLIYGLWEIPIITVFLLINPTAGIMIALLNAAILFAFFPGALPTGPFYNLIAIFSMMLGIYIAKKFIKHNTTEQQKLLKIATASTILGVILRASFMTIVNYITLRQPYPFGFELEEMAILAFLPSGVLFNGTVALYTVPISEFVANVVKSRLKLQN